MSLRDALQSVYDQRGELTPRLVVAEWGDPEHPDHNRLDWDKDRCAQRDLERQARDLIRSVDIVYRKAEGKQQPEGRVRAWQSVRGEDGYAYRPAEEVATDPLLRQLVLLDMTREWKQLKARYGAFAEFAEMVQADLHEAAS